MNCYLCALEQLANNAAGICVDCNRAVCLAPSTRRDHTVHGDLCGCGCHKTVCQADALSHAKAHGSGAPGCFSLLAVLVATPALGAATLLSDDSDVSADLRMVAQEQITRFLNDIAPGTEALWAARLALGGRSWQRASRLGDPRHEDVRFDSQFFAPARARRVASLAGAAVAHGVSRNGGPQVRSLLKPLKREVLDGLSSLSWLPPPRTAAPDVVKMLVNDLEDFLPDRDAVQQIAPLSGFDLTKVATGQDAINLLRVDEDEEPVQRAAMAGSGHR